MRTALIVAALCLAGPAAAGNTLAMGAGTNSCGQFLAAVGNAPIDHVFHAKQGGHDLWGEQVRYNEWMKGFASGFNSTRQGGEQDQINVDMAAIDVWLRKWCNENPTKLVFQGALVFRDEVMKNR